MNVVRHFFETAQKQPGKVAIIDARGQQITFDALALSVRQTAGYYLHKGIGKGDRVLVFIPMGIPLYRSILALLYIGAVPVFLDEWVSKERMETCCRLVHCRAFIAPFKLRAVAVLSGELWKIPIWLGTGAGDQEYDSAITETQADDTALITFTTGSTGIPKAADRTHAFLDAQLHALFDHLRPKDTDIDMPVLPIVLLLNLGTGVTSVIADFNPRKPASIDPQSIWNQIDRHKVNRLIASPFVAEQLAASPYRNKKSLRIFTGGAPVFPEQARKMISGLPGSSLEIVYGSTEAEPISSISVTELINEPETPEGGLAVGMPYAGIDVLILPITDKPMTFTSMTDMREHALRPGEMGEIVVSGAHVLQHYIDNPEAENRNKIRIGDVIWHRTGDAGFLRSDGRLFLCGRCSTLIRTDGQFIAPFLWEAWLCGLPGIQIGTIVGDASQLVIVLEAESGADRSMINALIHARLPEAAIRYLPKIPRDPRHFTKIEYGKLVSKVGRDQ